MGRFLLALATFSIGIGEPAGLDPPVADFDLTSLRGEVRRLSEWSGGRVVCVAFLKVGCPVAELYASPLAGIARRFESRGVRFLGVMIDEDQDLTVLDRFVTEHGIQFPLLRDGGVAASRLGASRTPEVFVLDDQRRVRYRGRIDDRYAVGSRRVEARSLDLVDALEDLLAGREVARPRTEPTGCPIGRPAAPGDLPMKAEVTYSGEIASILDRRCISCHRPGQIGPFSLQTYREATRRAGAIAEAVEERRMPPWHADPRFGRFANDGRLTDREQRLILDWTRRGCPEGAPADLPRPIDRPEGWRIPRPDLVVSMLEPYTVPAQGIIDYQTFEVDPGFTDDHWIRAAEVRPGNRRVVHHCNVFLKAPRSRSEVDAQGDLESYCLALTTPGSPPLEFPSGMAKRIPAGWRFVFVVHYSPIGTAQVDQTSIGLLFADRATVRKEVATNLLFDPDLRIPAGTADHRVEKSRRFESDVLLLSMFPHMHLRGKSFRYEALFPDGRMEVLLDVPRYDFQWQNRYDLAVPRRLPAGTTLRCVADYDNSSANPSNPDPTATVRTGPQSWDEMFNGYYDIALADQDLTRPLTWFETIAGPLGRSSGPAATTAGLASWFLVRSMRRRRAEPH